MSLERVRDEFLAARASGGDGTAFAEVARRYRPLVEAVAAHHRSTGVEIEDLRQEALLGLFAACRTLDPARGCRFAGWARVCVRNAVGSAHRNARAGKQLVLTDAVHDGEEVMEQLEHRVPAPAGTDPAAVVMVRDELRERVFAAHHPPRATADDRRRRYSEAQVAEALALIAEGKTLKQTAWEVGAPTHTIQRWLKRAGQPRSGGRRCFTPEEIRTAVALVQAGSSLRQAGAAVGASSPAVLRWVRKAA